MNRIIWWVVRACGRPTIIHEWNLVPVLWIEKAAASAIGPYWSYEEAEKMLKKWS